MKCLLLSSLLSLSLYALPFPELRSKEFPAVVPSYVPWMTGEAIFRTLGDQTKYGQHQTFFFLSDTTAIMAGHGINDKFDWRDINVLGVRPLAFYKYDTYLQKSKEEKNYLAWWVYDAAVVIFPPGTGDKLGITEKDYLSLSGFPFERTAAVMGPVEILGYVGRAIWQKDSPKIAPFRAGQNTVDRTENGQLFLTGYAYETDGPENILPAYGTSGGPLLDEKTGLVIGFSSWYAEEQDRNNIWDRVAPKGEKVAIYARTDSPESRLLYYAATHCSEVFPDMAMKYCASREGFAGQDSLTYFDYGFEIDPIHVGPGIRVKARKHGNCARAFLGDRESVVIRKIGQMEIKGMPELMSQLNALHPNDRSGLVFELDNEGRTQKEVFNRSLCMPRIIYGTAF